MTIIPFEEVHYLSLFPYEPYTIGMTKDGFIIHIRELEIRPFGEDSCCKGYGEKAFLRALKDLKAQYENTRYEGCVDYMLSQINSGELRI